jgi:hypothetical protein
LAGPLLPGVILANSLDRLHIITAWDRDGDFTASGAVLMFLVSYFTWLFAGWLLLALLRKARVRSVGDEGVA